MPKYTEIMGYKLFFWSNENNEPIHIHVAKGIPSKNATKLWITKECGVVICHNDSRIPKNDLNKIISYVRTNASDYIEMWYNYFGYEKYYC